MKALFISHFNTEAARGRDESCQRIGAEFSFVDSILIDTDCGQQRQPTCVANIQQTIEMSVYAIHLMPRLRPGNTAGLSKVTICCTAPITCGLHEALK